MYSAHFGLREPAFNLTPDPDFVYADAQHQAALDALVTALEQGEGFVKVTGEVGTGKTMLCRRLMGCLPASVVTIHLINPRVDPRGLLKDLAIELGLTVDDGANEQVLRHQIEGALQHLTGYGHRIVCCVDEAHALPIESLETLRLLSNLETHKRKLIQIAFFGQPEFDALLSTPPLRSLASRVGVSVSLGGLPYPDFRRYLKHRLVVAGWQGPRVFSDGAAQLLWRASGGVPRLANVLAHQCLVRASAHGVHHVCLKDALQVCLARWRAFGLTSRSPAAWAAS
ncbi:MAG TPA: AAA family ATPase [Aquabacterium sp.]|nr:AAA family ATPase [Aquabacterium sp.]